MFIIELVSNCNIISNNKLFHRAIGIISNLMKVSEETAKLSLLKSVHQTDHLTKV
jgi:hypothetical protein